MPNFRSQDALTRPLRDRFGRNALGAAAWETLVDELERLRFDAPPADLQDRFDDFLAAASAAAASSPECRVFVSHRQADTQYAERMAWLATDEGYGYWLDVHDPTLLAKSGAAIGSQP